MRSLAVASITAALIAPAAFPALAFAQPASAEPAVTQPSPPPAPPPAADAAAPAPEDDRTAVAIAPPHRVDDLEFSDRLVFDTGRHEYRPPTPETVTFAVRGEYQLRYRAMSDLRLEPPIRNLTQTTLGQNQYLYHWLRIGARFQFRDKFAIIGQIDIPRGLIVGDVTQSVDAARDSLSTQSWYQVHPRYLYLEYNSPIGVFRVGQQGSHWGMGILANDGDHPTLFGDYQRGALTERILFATSPMGKGTPLTIVVAGDLIFQDNTADLVTDHDRAFQGVAAVVYRTKRADLGVYGVIRHQERDRVAVDAYTPFTEQLTVGVIDWTGKFNTQIPGARGFLYGQLEAALVVGSTNALRSSYSQPIDARATRENEKVRSFGAAATLGAVHVAGHGKEQWGNVVGELEAGYASGDANPYDGVTKRFTFDPNHNVGLVLFKQVMGWKTARAATIAQDPNIVDRASPGLQLLPSKGGIFGAQYINPRFIYRPRHWVDLKTGVVLAQTTADFVDPYQAGALGSFRNYDGGDVHKHDLGIEVDLGADVRIPIDRTATVQLGAEGGVLFPGHAFDDALGHSLPNQYLGNVKVGLQF